MDYLNASYHAQADTEARLARMEARLAYAEVSLAYMEASRRYIELRFKDHPVDDLDHAGDAGLPAPEDTVLEGLSARLAKLDAYLTEMRSRPAYAEAEIVLSDVEAGLEDVEVGLVGIGAALAHEDTLLSEVGVGRGAPTLVRIPLPSAGSQRERGLRGERRV
jgi:hypothetical protein